MAGGMRAWNGLQARGAPKAGMALFDRAGTLEELVGVAWKLEEGSHLFYADLAASGAAEADLFSDLAEAEEAHQRSLLLVYQETAGAGIAASFLHRHDAERILEGGVPLDRALAWARGRPPREVLEFTMALEIDAYDLYVRLERRFGGTPSARVLAVLAREEKAHLAGMAARLETMV